MAWTNLGKEKMFRQFFEASSVDTQFWLMAAASGATTWDATLSSTSQITPVSAVNGYPASGYVVPRDGVSGFVVSANEIAGGWAQASLVTGYQLSADGGVINNVHYFILADNSSDVAAREIYAFWSTGSDVDIGAGNTLSITAAALRGT